jgi:sensor c-di-GMP phosphodiesterase-like protein
MFLDPDVKVLAHLDRLAQLGVQISLDDFGTGYASVSFLENFSVDVLKLDRAFVNDAEKTPKRRVLAEAIINMAKALELEVVAEGIETQAQSDWLQAAGCEYGQGYLYSKPLTPEKLLEQLQERQA